MAAESAELPTLLRQLTNASAGSNILSGMTRFSYQDFIGSFGDHPRPPSVVHLGSTLCQQEDFSSNEFRYWCFLIREAPRFHRKQWEFFFICQSLFKSGALKPGMHGLCFGAGVEPLPVVFASMGRDIVASDQAIEEAQLGGWTDSNQHAISLDALNGRKICEDEKFATHVSLRTNEIPEDLFNGFDFCWSACCFEHLGSLEHGMRFVEQSIRTLKPGGIAVHTTEFNLSSNEATCESRHLSIYRRRDIDALIDRLTCAGHHVVPVNWSRGSGRLDRVIDLPPCGDEPHLRLQLSDYECTSIGLIIRRGR